MAKKNTQSSEKLQARTPQQWAWQFLRRNPDYIASYALISSLTKEQYAQLQGLIALQKGIAVEDSYFDEAVIASLDLCFFEAERWHPAEASKEVSEQYRKKPVSQRDIDAAQIKVSNRFLLETYCLDRWLDPIKFVELDADFAAKLWVHHPSIEWGLAYAPWLTQMEGVELKNFRPVPRVGRSFNASLLPPTEN